MGKKQKRFRLKPEIALSIGCELNKSNRYRLSDRQIKMLENLNLGRVKRLFFDIETSPMVVYSWRIGWKINLSPDNIIEDWKVICISYKWEHEDEVRHFVWDAEKKCDKEVLRQFIEVANLADELIAHNGDKFDIKKIRTRCIYHRIPMFPTYRTLDTLKKARSGFNFNSNRLDYIARFLGVGAKVEHEGFTMWKKCMEGDEDALKAMVHYCDGDIVVLEDVFTVMQNYITQNTNTAVASGGYKYQCPSCGSDHVHLHKNSITPKGTIQRMMQCDSCNYGYSISNSSYKVYLENEITKENLM